MQVIVCHRSMRIILFTMSKIQIFESNSQRLQPLYNIIMDCSRCQRYKFLKAIHNLTSSLGLWEQTVHDVKDTNFWKQFTTAFWHMNKNYQLFTMSKIQIFESNSQHTHYLLYLVVTVHDVKDTNFWKQFTTFFPKTLW